MIPPGLDRTLCCSAVRNSSALWLQVHGELKLTIQRAESMINSVVQSAPSDPALSSRLGPSICLPNTLVHLACLLTRAAVLSLERSKAVSKRCLPLFAFCTYCCCG